jgi:hypothetical protein
VTAREPIKERLAERRIVYSISFNENTTNVATVGCWAVEPATEKLEGIVRVLRKEKDLTVNGSLNINYIIIGRKS